MNMIEDAYRYVQRTNIFSNLISIKNSDNIYVLSEALTSFEYSNIEEDNIKFICETRFKINILKGLREILNNTGKSHIDIVVTEDSISVLLDVNKLNNPRIKCYLVSDFYKN